MGLSLSSLQILASLNLSTEQMAGVVQVLTVELAPLEQRRASAAARQSRYRHAHSNVDSDVTVDATVALPASRVSILPSLSENVETVRNPLVIPPPTPKGEHPAFSFFWSLFPKRAGDRDRKAAVKAFAAAIKRASEQEILEGTERYAAFCDAMGKTGTEFVRQARTWLNADGWKEPYEISRSATNGTSIHDNWAIASAVLREQDRREGICREGSEDDLRALPEPEGRA